MLGKKVGMTQIFDDKGMTVPVTLLTVGPCTITQIVKRPENKFTKVQMGYEYIKPNKLTKPQLGHFKNNRLPCFRHLKEYKTHKANELYIGDNIDINLLKVGSYITVSGRSIGKGFSGYQKRHNFTRGPMSHGSKNHRKPGSIGAGTTPGRVFPGKRMAGHKGNKNVSIRNLKIIDINKNTNVISIKGSVPGKRGNLIYIYTR